MGTRNLTSVIHKQKVRIAQYGQWDGYPEGQGVTIFDFVRDENNVNKLRAKLDTDDVRFQTPQDIESKKKWMADNNIGEWINMTQAQLVNETFPFLNRDLGASILAEVAYAEGTVVLVDSTDFAQNGLFCEYAWLVDLDNESVSMFTGFHRERIEKGHFYREDYDGPEKHDEYIEVQPIATVSFQDVRSRSNKELVQFFDSFGDEEE